MSGTYIGQVEIHGRWSDIVENVDKDYVFHCLEYEAYDEMQKRVVLLLAYVPLVTPKVIPTEMGNLVPDPSR